MRKAQFAYCGGQIIGARSEQQDCYATGPARLRSGETASVHVIADGMGGHSGGAIAARSAVDAFLAMAGEGGFDTWPQMLDRALLAANRAIGEHARANPVLKGMGCTFLAVIPLGGILHYISVGDSPFFRLLANGLERVNCDHSMAPLIDVAASNAEMTLDEARNHPQRSALRSALVGSPVSLIDMQTIETRPGEIFLLASDGLLSIDEPQIVRTMIEHAPHGPTGIVANLLAQVEALQAPDQDNCTLVVLCESEMPANVLSSRWPALAMIAVGITITAFAIWIGYDQYAASGRAGQTPDWRTPVADFADPGNPRLPGRPYREGYKASDKGNEQRQARSPNAAKSRGSKPGTEIAATASDGKPDQATDRSEDNIGKIIDQNTAAAEAVSKDPNAVADQPPASEGGPVAPGGNAADP